jgi:Fe-Mn family superoxide dismutase
MGTSPLSCINPVQANIQLVRSNSSQLDVDIVPTFAAGTLLVSNRSQRGRNDTAELYLEPEASAPESTGVPEPEPEIASDPNSPTEVPPTLSLPPASSFSRAIRRSENTWPIPLAVLNLYELAYMGEKYGVWGKKQYAADWWRSLNWEEVVRRNAKAQ